MRSAPRRDEPSFRRRRRDSLSEHRRRVVETAPLAQGTLAPHSVGQHKRERQGSALRVPLLDEATASLSLQQRVAAQSVGSLIIAIDYIVGAPFRQYGGGPPLSKHFTDAGGSGIWRGVLTLGDGTLRALVLQAL